MLKIDGGIEVVPPFVDEDRVTHVTPLNDLRDHHHNSRGKCWCRPYIECDDNGWLVLHNSMDGRESFERGDRLPS